MHALPLSVTYDYRCPFARNAHEHVVAAMRDGAPWEVEFVPFSLSQVHVEEGAPPVWEDPARSEGLIAVEAGLVVKEIHRDRFSDVHLALFTARHDEGRDIRDEGVLRDILSKHGVDPDEVFSAIADGWPRQAFRKAHEAAAAEHDVFGVPTFILGEEAAFVRIMTRPTDDPAVSRVTIDQVVALLQGHPELNEFKHTSVPN